MDKQMTFDNEVEWADAIYQFTVKGLVLKAGCENGVWWIELTGGY